MWLYKTGEPKDPIILYDYQNTRSSSCPCEQLYKIEKDLREKYAGDDDYYDKRYETRLEKYAPIIEEFIKYVDIEINNVLPRSPLG